MNAKTDRHRGRYSLIGPGRAAESAKSPKSVDSTQFATLACLATPFHPQVSPQTRRWPTNSHVDHARQPLDLLDGIELPVPGAGTSLLHGLPGFGTFQVGIPKRPCPALCRSGGIHRAAPRLGVEERAVPVLALRQRSPLPDTPRLFAADFIDCLSQERCDSRDFVISDPHDSRCAGAAVAALGACEAQTVIVPG
jgi:hypothetical protein